MAALGLRAAKEGLDGGIPITGEDRGVGRWRQCRSGATGQQRLLAALREAEAARFAASRCSPFRDTCSSDPRLDKRLPYDPTAAKKLPAEAGDADGLRSGPDCPNDVGSMTRQSAKQFLPCSPASASKLI